MSLTSKIPYRLRCISNIYRMLTLMAEGSNGVFIPYNINEDLSFDYIEILPHDFMLIRWKDQEIEFQFSSEMMTDREIYRLQTFLEECFQNWLNVK